MSNKNTQDLRELTGAEFVLVGGRVGGRLPPHTPIFGPIFAHPRTPHISFGTVGSPVNQSLFDAARAPDWLLRL